MKEDIYIKDEGDFVTVVLQTDKAINATGDLSAGRSTGNKWDVLIDYIPNIVVWAASHNLTIQSEIDINIPHEEVNF